MTRDTQRVAVVDRAEILVRVRHSPEHVIGRVQQHRGVQCVSEFGCDSHVVVVPVRADHRDDVPTADGHHDRARVVCGVEDHDLGVVPDEPDIVVDFPTAAVEFERAVGDNPLNRTAVHVNATTLRSTSPACILWKASSMSPSPMRSETNFSSGSRPWVYKLIKVGKSRSGRQSPYHDDFNEPPREKKSISGISNVMSGVGTPTSTTVPARSRA